MECEVTNELGELKEKHKSQEIVGDALLEQVKGHAIQLKKLERSEDVTKLASDVEQLITQIQILADKVSNTNQSITDHEQVMSNIAKRMSSIDKEFLTFKEEVKTKIVWGEKLVDKLEGQKITAMPTTEQTLPDQTLGTAETEGVRRRLETLEEQVVRKEFFDKLQNSVVTKETFKDLENTMLQNNQQAQELFTQEITLMKSQVDELKKALSPEGGSAAVNREEFNTFEIKTTQTLEEIDKQVKKLKLETIDTKQKIHHVLSFIESMMTAQNE
ncbi:hypothetical protein GOV04_03870 [Candidatus Woesearchaeota archaeon]|nr:hypothetical protein [Candidatus Woesearchaeota archaeon]